MAEQTNTIKIKPSSPDQGDFVLINEADFDASVHQVFDAAPAEPVTRRAKKAHVAEPDAQA
jgi:hypothetical protein